MSTMLKRGAVLAVGLATAGTLLAAPANAAPVDAAPANAGPANVAPGRPARITLPQLTGRHQVGTTDLHLVDRARQDPWQPAAQRELMVTVTYPAARSGGTRAAWMPPAFAKYIEGNFNPEIELPPGSVDWGGVQRQARDLAAVERGRWPVVLFSHGFGSSRELNTVLTDDLASHGYVVVSISHPGDAMAVTFPDGRLIVNNIDQSDQAAMKTALDARVADARFVLDEVTRLNRGANPDAERDPLPRGIVGTLDLSAVGMFGHSYGGFAAAETMYHDRRFDAGINLDGGLAVGGDGEPGESTKHGVGRPFLLVGADHVNPETGQKSSQTHRPADSASWSRFWANQRGWKRDLHFDQAAHSSFTDFQLPGFVALLPEPLRSTVVGTIDPLRSLTAQRDYFAAFFDLHLKHRDRHLFDRDNPKHPNTRFVP